VDSRTGESYWINPAWKRERALAQGLARHLAGGGSVMEFETEWKLGDNCFMEPDKSNPVYIGNHIAARAARLFNVVLQLTQKGEK
jgi:hypothetical protein